MTIVMSPMTVVNAHHANKDLRKYLALALLFQVSHQLPDVSSMPALTQIAISAAMDIFWQPIRNAINLPAI